MIAVTGASGGIGGRVARALAAEGAPLRLVVRDASRAPDLDADTVERIAGHAPRSLADVLREHPESTAHLQR